MDISYHGDLKCIARQGRRLLEPYLPGQQSQSSKSIFTLLLAFVKTYHLPHIDTFSDLAILTVLNVNIITGGGIQIRLVDGTEKAFRKVATISDRTLNDDTIFLITVEPHEHALCASA